jgi:NADP-dependent 3-hydroxy acid dehydrogenase YdfG
VRDFTGKRYWLVGASEGLGQALAERLSAAGAEVILSARNADRLAEVAAALPGKAMVVPVDVADTLSVRAAAAAAGLLDGVV